MKKPTEKTMHTILGINEDVYLIKIGEMSQTELDLLRSIPLSKKPSTWNNSTGLPNHDKDDIELSKQYEFDLKPCIEKNSVFYDYKFTNTSDIFKNIIKNRYPKVFNYTRKIFMFLEASFVNLHNDASLCSSRGQIMFVLDNIAEHTLLSINKKNEHILLTPKAGDIVMLDIVSKHALIPNQKLGIDFMFENTFKFMSINFKG